MKFFKISSNVCVDITQYIIYLMYLRDVPFARFNAESLCFSPSLISLYQPFQITSFQLHWFILLYLFLLTFIFFFIIFFGVIVPFLPRALRWVIVCSFSVFLFFLLWLALTVSQKNLIWCYFCYHFVQNISKVYF